jgi:peptide/nickel transport system ATP-binding protein
MTPILEIRGATKIYRSGLFGGNVTVALDDMTLAIEEDRPTIAAVVGESGSGKTTLGSLLLGFIDATKGQALYRGKEIHRLSGAERSAFRREVQAIFQDPFAAYNPFYTVDHVLSVPIDKFKLARSRADARRLMEDALIAVGMRPEETLGRYPHQLSGGQRQRIIVARAMLLKPKVIIADEPVSMVDASLRATILESIYKLHKDLGISVLYITHDLTTAYHIGQQIVVMYRGSVMEAGDTETVVTNPQHPYTRLLIDSVPWPDPDRRWGQLELTAREGGADADRGCKFAARCPYATEPCYAAPPPLYQTNGEATLADGHAVAASPGTAAAESGADGRERVVACYLWQEFPSLAREALPSLLARSGTALALDNTAGDEAPAERTVAVGR